MFDLLLEKLNDVHVITGFLISLILCFSFAKIYMFIIEKSGLIKKENKEIDIVNLNCYLLFLSAIFSSIVFFAGSTFIIVVLVLILFMLLVLLFQVLWKYLSIKTTFTDTLTRKFEFNLVYLLILSSFVFYFAYQLGAYQSKQAKQCEILKNKLLIQEEEIYELRNKNREMQNKSFYGFY